MELPDVQKKVKERKQDPSHCLKLNNTKHPRC